MKIRHAYRLVPAMDDAPEHIARRDLSIYEPDPRDLDEAGNPPTGFLQAPYIALEPGEVEFGHEASDDELRAAFPDFYARQK